VNRAAGVVSSGWVGYLVLRRCRCAADPSVAHMHLTSNLRTDYDDAATLVARPASALP
jgi:hypothetical protein